jgi:hypothetical protein
MSKTWRGVTVLLLVLIAAMVSLLPILRPTAYGGGIDESGAPASSHYTVVMTEGHNLLVTDNTRIRLYFYTVDKDKPVGEPLKLRAEIDLNKVGQPEIKNHAARVGEVSGPTEGTRLT